MSDDKHDKKIDASGIFRYFWLESDSAAIGDFSLALSSGVLSIIALSVAYIGFFRTSVARWQKWALSIAGLVLVAHNEIVIAIGAAAVMAILWTNALTAARQVDQQVDQATN